MNYGNNKISLNKDKTDDELHPEIILVGQPNCGKSTIFNQVAGYRSVTSNFPGATVIYTRSHVRINNQTCDLVDLPGTYSLTCIDCANAETQHYILTCNIDLIINVVDASTLSRSLELTLQLLELEMPTVLCLNMMDEAARKGIYIDIEDLSKRLRIPVVSTIGSKGLGIDHLFRESFKHLRSRKKAQAIKMSRHVEQAISYLDHKLSNLPGFSHTFSSRLIAVKLLEKDPYFEEFVKGQNGNLRKSIKQQRSKLETAHGQSADMVISSERHALAMQIFEESSTVKHSKVSWRDKIDEILMHNVWGYVFMFAFLFLFFNIIFKVGGFVESPIMDLFARGIESLGNSLGDRLLLFNFISGIVQGFAGGVAIVLPYLVPFLLGLAFVEDIGYLPRMAFLMDGLMHRIGLHGTSVIPAVLGYGCSVPAVMATRILESRRDRFIASVVAVMVPCSARMTVIFGLVGYYLGGTAALAVYLLNIIVIAITGNIMSRLMPEDTPGMALEIPAYHMPSAKVIITKTWLRLKDFIIIAWPLLIIGSITLSLAEYFHVDLVINQILSPITSMLGLPTVVGTTLIFGILRKELSMLMLLQALGVTDVSTVLDPGQILVFTVFIVFYIPCLATIGAMAKEIGWRHTIYTSIFTLILALTLGGIVRVISTVIM